MDYQKTSETSHKNIISDEESIIDSPAKRWLSWVNDLKIESWSTIITSIFALYVRWAVGLNPYSGYNTPPMYGDYEAQRHWMELTLHIPINRWYYYDLDWWGLDYPPLTAYVSWICGKIGSILDPTWFALDSSRGYESDESKLFMRSTVLICDYLIYVPAVLVFVNWWFAGNSWKKRELAVLLILLQPALILIDHGHFQYNSVMLGLTLWAVNCFFYDHDVLGSIFFCLALSFKQMALYFAPAIFSYLLGKCIKNDIRGVMKLGITVIVTFGIVFYPFLGSLEQISQVIIRIFPLQRGLYEDKVANIWCAINVIIKLREIFDINLLAKISLITTLFAILPSCIYLGSNPDKRYLIYGLANSSLAFFLFSFQVHEKSILLPALPICLLILDDVFWCSWFINVAIFSMFPLLKKDKLILSYFIVWLMWNWIGSFIKKDTKPIILKYLSWLSYFVMALIHILEFNIPPPKRYPDIYVVLNVIFSAVMFTIFLFYFNYQQIISFIIKRKAE
ncbi:ALG6, ALG8 glycosyltransferase [Gigaspora margarita]|uniref:Alpha-1,3-glucosyltransferase n=1 Tax=Gigaspora margarita TaxID=4874 RepID=A0A8H4AM64_GIGMA|nr:ALG6, ALG8 glycosyltransferase [Gigaspora margarita]